MNDQRAQKMFCLEMWIFAEKTYIPEDLISVKNSWLKITHLKFVDVNFIEKAKFKQTRN